MTCIIGFVDKEVTWLAGDSMGSSSVVSGKPYKDAKIFKVKNKPIIIGYTSSFRMGQLLEFHPEIFPDLLRTEEYSNREYLVTKVIPNLLQLYKDSGWDMKTIAGDREGGTFLIGVKGHVYIVQDDFSILESLDNYNACGCGEDLALGSVATSIINKQDDIKEILKTAMKVTAHHSPGVQPPFRYITIKGDFGIL